MRKGREKSKNGKGRETNNKWVSVSNERREGEGRDEGEEVRKKGGGKRKKEDKGKEVGRNETREDRQ